MSSKPSSRRQRAAQRPVHHGLLLIDKQADGTSHDVVQRVRRITRQKKIGHCGTLDPTATGLLLLTVGQATRLTRFLIRAPKVYHGTVRFGVETDTYDAAGTPGETGPGEGFDRDAVARAMAAFEGTIEHIAPAYSAKKVQGKKLYELARKGEEVPREAKEVTVYEFSPQGELTPWEDDFDGRRAGAGDGGAETGAAGAEETGPGEAVDEAPTYRGVEIGFRLGCASGTYARTLAHDLGRALGTRAHLGSLRRVQIGPFDLTDAITVEELAERLHPSEEGDESEGLALPDLGSAWVPFDSIPLPFGQVTADAQQEQRISHGQTVLVRELEGDEGDWIQLMNSRRQLIAVGTVVERFGDRGVGVIQPRVVFT